MYVTSCTNHWLGKQNMIHNVNLDVMKTKQRNEFGYMVCVNWIE